MADNNWPAVRLTPYSDSTHRHISQFVCSRGKAHFRRCAHAAQIGWSIHWSARSYGHLHLARMSASTTAVPELRRGTCGAPCRAVIAQCLPVSHTCSPEVSDSIPTYCGHFRRLLLERARTRATSLDDDVVGTTSGQWPPILLHECTSDHLHILVGSAIGPSFALRIDRW